MKISLFTLLIFISFSSCKRDMVTHHLNAGLEELEHSRPINEKLIEGYEIKKIGFFKITDNQYKIALLLNTDIKPEIVEKYTLGMHMKSENSKFMPKGKNYISWDTIVGVKTYNEYKYIIRDIKTPVRNVSSLRIFLYNLGVYEKREGEQIMIRNIKL